MQIKNKGRKNMIQPFVVGNQKPFTVLPFYIEKEEGKTENDIENQKPVHMFTIGLQDESKQEIEIVQDVSEVINQVQEKKNVNINTATSEKKVQKIEEKGVIKEAFKPVSNYVLTPIEKIIFIDREGCEDAKQEKIRFWVKINEEQPKSMEIRTVEIYKVAKLVGARFSTAIIDSGESKVEKIIEEEFRKKTKDIRITRCYTNAGWQKINGIMRYVHDSCFTYNEEIIMTGLNLPSFQCKDIELKNWINKALHLYNDPVAMSTMFLYAFSGVTYRIFSECGYEPHFLLFLNGKTGSMKTTLAKILFQQLVQEQHREHVRRIDSDTVVSFERVIVKRGVDTVTVFDDYAPAKTQKKKMEMQEKLEAIIRMVGDGSTKSRSNQTLEDVQGDGVKGTVVLTGEIRGNGLSSNLRCVYCEIVREKAILDNVTFFQEKKYAITTIVKRFTDFLSQNWGACKEFILQQFPQKRHEISLNISEKRMIDAVVVLHLIADILNNFFTQCCAYSVQEANEICSELKQNVVKNVIYSLHISEEETPAIKYLTALNLLIEQKKILLCQKTEFRLDGKYVGFEDELFIYLIPEIAYETVYGYLRTMNQYFPFDLRETTICLYEDGYIKAYSNGAGKRTYYARIATDNSGKKQKFLKISKSIMKQIAEAD